ncbi:MAG: hypothetical protein QXZ44_06860, partial [Ferroplasma sp.]
MQTIIESTLPNTQKMVFNLSNFYYIYPQLIISLIIAIALFLLILKKYPQNKLFFAIKNTMKYSYAWRSSKLDRAIKPGKCPPMMIGDRINSMIFIPHQEIETLKNLKSTYNTIFLLMPEINMPTRISKFHGIKYRDFFEGIYAILVLITTFVLLLIISSPA